jgi:low affinity Fe/Cu permease
MTMTDAPGQRQSTSSLKNDLPQPGLFQKIAGWTIRATGGRWGFFTAFSVIAIWALTGPFFHFSELWQLVINTGTSIVTFLMVFLIQNAQNRESKAVHLKLDELIYAVKAANNAMIHIEALTEEQLEELAERYRKVAERHHRVIEAGRHNRLEEEIDRKVNEKVEAKASQICAPANGKNGTS